MERWLLALKQRAVEPLLDLVQEGVVRLRVLVLQHARPLTRRLLSLQRLPLLQPLLPLLPLLLLLFLLLLLLLLPFLLHGWQ